MEFTVKRSDWYRGSGHLQSALLRRDGKKCCVGFYCLAAGLSENQISEVKTILALPQETEGLNKLPEWSRKEVYTVFEIYSVNDDSIISDSEREERLTTLFESAGDTVHFVD